LGIAYVVLGGVLPRIFEALLRQSPPPSSSSSNDTSSSQQRHLQSRAFLAVATTALIIKLSEFLATNPGVTDGWFYGFWNDHRPEAHLVVMLAASLSQWALLDGSLPALIAASVTSIGGPLSELPFVANGVWDYLDAASDYFPLQNVADHNLLFQSVLGDNYQNLALSSITGPCYFAVTMDAIALGRWFDSSSSSESSSNTDR
jgi:hypothetical protein